MSRVFTRCSSLLLMLHTPAYNPTRLGPDGSMRLFPALPHFDEQNNDSSDHHDCRRRNCLNAKSSEERVVYKKLNSTNVDSENNHGGSSKDICITSDWMFTRRRSATASRMPAVRFTRKARSEQHAGNWTAG